MYLRYRRTPYCTVVTARTSIWYIHEFEFAKTLYLAWFYHQTMVTYLLTYSLFQSKSWWITFWNLCKVCDIRLYFWLEKIAFWKVCFFELFQFLFKEFYFFLLHLYWWAAITFYLACNAKCNLPPLPFKVIDWLIGL